MQARKPVFILWRWYMIVIGFILFWPAGLVLLTIRVLIDWERIFRRGNIMCFFGVLLLIGYGYAMYWIITSPSSQGKDMTMTIGILTLAAFIPGSILFGRGVASNKREVELAAKRETARAEFIERKRIFDHERSLMLNKLTGQKESAAAATGDDAALLPKAMSCSSCGAQSNVNPQSSVACPYCGSIISYS